MLVIFMLVKERIRPLKTLFDPQHDNNNTKKFNLIKVIILRQFENCVENIFVYILLIIFNTK